MLLYLWFCHESPIVVFIVQHVEISCGRINQRVAELALASFQHPNGDVGVLGETSSNDESYLCCRKSSGEDARAG
jgi:hypothetical protein